MLSKYTRNLHYYVCPVCPVSCAHLIDDFGHDGDGGVSVSAQGAAAVLFMQLCKRIHSQLSSGVEPGTNPGALTGSTSLHRCGYRLLLEIRESLSH